MPLPPIIPPRHIAIVMDGNGRWARSRGLPRIEGHRAGVRAVREVTTACARMGVGVLTLFAFSKENWRRPKAETGALMRLLALFLRKETPTLLENGVRLRAIGEREDLPTASRRALEEVEERTSAMEGMTLVLALSYGGRQDILRGVRKAAAKAAQGRLDLAALDEDGFSGLLDTAGLPDPDLLIRTSGEMRLSNFLLWQCAYSEFVVTPVLWPDFGEKELDRAIREFAARERRFGMTSAQVVPGHGEEEGEAG